MQDDMVERVAIAIKTAGERLGAFYDINESELLALARAAIEAMRELAPKCEQCGGILPFDYQRRMT